MAPDRDDSVSGNSDVENTRVIPEDDDHGKDVVDTRGQDIGMVTKVEGDTMYVDPHPSLTEKIMSTLNWDTDSEEALPVPPEFVERIDEQVVLRVERDEEFQEETS